MRTDRWRDTVSTQRSLYAQVDIDICEAKDAHSGGHSLLMYMLD